MALTNTQKIQVLLESFDLLKEDFRDSSEELQKIILQLCKMDVTLAFDMWLGLLEYAEDDLKTCAPTYGWTYDLTMGLLYELNDIEWPCQSARVFIDNKKLSKYVLLYSTTFNWVCSDLIGAVVNNREFELADRLISYLYENKRIHEDTSFIEILQMIIDASDECRGDDGAYSLFQSWIDRIDDKKDKAKLNAYLMTVA